MAIHDYQIKAYKIIPPIHQLFSWGAKCTIYIGEKEIAMGEFRGETKEEATRKAIAALDRLLSK